MKKIKLREDTTCQNCGTQVDDIFCPHCGQKNTETRKPFYLLFADFFTSFINYDSSLWRTARHLFFSPAKLSKEYIAGKRNSYVDPVKLYLFAGFIAFSISAILPTPPEVAEVPGATKADEVAKAAEVAEHADLTKTEKKKKKKKIKEVEIELEVEDKNPPMKIGSYGKVRTVEQLDSIHNSRPENERLSTSKLYSYKILLALKEKMNRKEEKEKTARFIVDNFPKVLLLYMPVFAFFLWLFHGKKKRLYFDSGIFTLHFFSLFLLVSAVVNIMSCILDDWLGREELFDFVFFGAPVYVTFYFFRAHRNFYGERRFISNLKATSLFFINTFLITVVLTVFFIMALTV